VQTLQVARQCLHLLLAQLLRDRGHDLEVRLFGFVGLAGLVFLEAARDIAGVLATNVRIGRAGITGAAGAVAGHAGRQAALGVAAAVQLLADLVELHALVGAVGDRRVIGDAGGGLLGGEERADVAHVLRGEVLHERHHRHRRTGAALAVGDQGHLLGDVAFALAGDGRVHLHCAV